MFKTTALSGGIATWSSEKELITVNPDWCYQGSSLAVGTQIHFVHTRGDDPSDAFRLDVDYLRYETSDESLKNATASVSTASGSLPVSAATLNASYRIYTQAGQTGDIPSLTFDTNGNPHVLYCNGSIAGAMTLFHTALFSGSWTSPVTLATINSAFSEFEVVRAASGTVSAYWTDFDGAHVDGGNLKTATRSSGSGGTWGSSSTVRVVETWAFNEPQQILNGHSDLRMIYTEVNQFATDVTAGGLKLYALGDRGHVGEAGLSGIPRKLHHFKQQMGS